MKKVILFFLTLFVASSVWADEHPSIRVDGILYYVNTGNNTVDVGSGNQDLQGDVVVPATIRYDGQTYKVASIGAGAFMECTNISSVTIPNSVTSIENATFEGCTRLISITIPNSVTSIGAGAFEDCKNLPSITIPNSVTSIGEHAFYGCTGLTSITIPSSVTSIKASVFYGCTNLTSIKVGSGNTKYDSRDNCNAIIETATNTIIRGCKNTEIPNSVTSIGEYAFRESGLYSFTIPNSVTSIEEYAFQKSGLTSITISNSVTEIKKGVFHDCPSLTSITIPNSVTSIGESAFNGCTGLTSITIPSSVTSIGGNAFMWCTNIRQVTCLATIPPKISLDRAFFTLGFYEQIDYEPCTLLVPCESVEDYKKAYDWDRFNSIECLESETVELTKDEVKVEPERSEAVFTMPQNESANSYTLTIQNNGVTFCTLTFNAQGQLSNIDFSTTKSYELKASVSAYQFTVTGLSEATDYGYSFKALASNKSVLKEYTGSFTTKNGDGTGGSSQGGAEVGGGSGQGGEGGEQGGEGGNQTAINGVSNATTVAIVGNQILVNGEAPAFVYTIMGQKIANQNLKSGVYFVVVDGETVGVSVR